MNLEASSHKSCCDAGGSRNESAQHVLRLAWLHKPGASGLVKSNYREPCTCVFRVPATQRVSKES